MFYNEYYNPDADQPDACMDAEEGDIRTNVSSYALCPEGWTPEGECSIVNDRKNAIPQSNALPFSAYQVGDLTTRPFQQSPRKWDYTFASAAERTDEPECTTTDIFPNSGNG